MPMNEIQPKVLEEGKQFLPQFEKRGGLLPAIVQDQKTMEILMLAWVNEEALFATLETRLATFWSTSRQELWVKGKTSGDLLELMEIRVDCDQDALIYLVQPKGQGACHTKNAHGHARTSCFYRKIQLPRDESLGKDQTFLTFIGLNKKNPVNRQ